MTNADVVAELWRRVEARDWDGFGALLADDVVFDWPHSRERIRGRANVVEVNRRYPEGWAIEVRRVVADGDVVVSEIRVPHAEMGTFWAASFFELRDGVVARASEYWVEEGVEEPPEWRAPLTELLP